MDPLAADRQLSGIPCFCDEWDMLVRKVPDAVFLTEECSGKSYTRKQADELSARVYGWLALHGIGKENIVIIRLPRDARPFIAMLGVWKAGAAFVVLEEDYAPERIEAIRQDCECRLMIDEHTWPEILDTPPRGGFVRAVDHDLCFAIYTPGDRNRLEILYETGFDITKTLPEGTECFMGFDKRTGLYTRMQVVLIDTGKATDPLRCFFNYDMGVYSEELVLRFAACFADALDSLA